MTRMIDVEVEQKRIKISFPYKRELVEVVRTLPDRWYENRTKTWFVPLQHLNYVIERLDGYHFKYSPALRKFRGQTKGETGDKPPQPALQAVPDGTWTISRLNHAARAALRQRFDESIWVVGELQDFDKNRSSNYQNYFFDLVERPFAGANEVARLKAVLFDRHRQTIARRLRNSDLKLADGLAVRLRGKIDLYARNGRYQILVDDIDPAYTAGEIELNRERVYRGLKKKGVENDNLRLSWPVCPLRVGLITSVDSDAYNDFVHTLEQSGIGFLLTAHHANVQGVHTERSVLAALSYFRENAHQFDVVAIIRGGGSRSELAYFDTEAIGEAVCGHPLKIICGVGHQRDTCLLDLISESTKTPTAAAARVVEAVEEFRYALDERQMAIAERAEGRVERDKQILHRAAARLERQVVRRLGTARQRQARLEGDLGEQVRRALAKKQRLVDARQDRLDGQLRRTIDRRRYQVDGARRQLSLPRLERRLLRRRQDLARRLERVDELSRRQGAEARRHLKQVEQRLELVDPRTILKRGFALVRTKQGLVRSPDDVDVGQDFNVILGQGSLRARRLADAETDTTDSKDKSDKSKTPQPHEG